MHIIFLPFLLGLMPLNVTIQSNDTVDLDKFKLILHKGDSLFLNRTRGIVYKLSKGVLTRIDNSYDDKIHTGSLDFIYKDTLYRFGGYGYFSTNKNLIYFDEATRQWDLVKYKGFEKIESFSSVGIHFIRDDELYVLGYDTHVNKYQNESNFKHEGFIYNLDQQKIKERLTINPSFEFPRSYFQVNNAYVFLFYPNIRKLRIVSTSNLDLYTYNLNQVESSIVNKNNEEFTMKDDQLSFKIRTINRTDKEHQINIGSVLNNMVYEGNLMVSKTNPYYYLILLVVGLLSMVAYVRITKKDTIILMEDTITFKKKKIVLNPQMSKVVQKLMESPEVPNSELNEIFYKEGQNNIHINREKNNCIDKINFMTSLNFNEDLILRKKSDFDKRMVVFYLNEKFNV